MKHVKTMNTSMLKNTMAKGGCGECQTSCQSACKTRLAKTDKKQNFACKDLGFRIEVLF